MVIAMRNKRKYYAEIIPNGFGNMVETYVFPDKEARERFLAEHDVSNGTTQRAITAKEAIANLSYNHRGERLRFRAEPYRAEPWVAEDEIPKSFTEKLNPCGIGEHWVASHRRRDGVVVRGHCAKDPRRR